MGGQDELVFDGDSIIVDQGGRVIARAPQFESGLMVADLELTAATDEPHGPSPMPIVAHTLSTTPVPSY